MVKINRLVTSALVVIFLLFANLLLVYAIDVMFTDDFTRSNSDNMGTNWTEASGDTDIISNIAHLCY